MEMRNVSLKTPVRNQGGFVGIIMMMGLTTIAAMGLLSSTFQKRQIQLSSENKLSIDVLQQNYAMYIQDDESWKKTYNDTDNSSFACIRNASPCSKTSQPINILRNAKDEIVVNTASEKGIKPDGTICDVFDGAGAATPGCDLRVTLTWKPICKGACIGPAVIQVNIAIDRSAAASTAARFIASSNSAGVVRKPTSTPPVSQVAVGKFHTCVIASGEVYCWGLNDFLQLGQPWAVPSSSRPLKVPGLSGVSAISASQYYTCAIVTGGQVKCWGSNSLAALGFNNGGIPVMTPTTVFKNSDGLPLTNIVKITAGTIHNCGIDTAGAAYCWGANGQGKMGFFNPPGLSPGDQWSGDGAYPVLTLNSGVTEISAGVHTTCAVHNGGVKCWGHNAQTGGSTNACWEGQRTLGYNPVNAAGTAASVKGHKTCYPYFDETTPAAILTAFGYTFPSCSTPLTINLRKFLCNPVPQTPDDSSFNGTDHPELAPGTNVKGVMISGITTCAIIADGTLRCWGNNFGKLGRQYPDGMGVPTYTTYNNFPNPMADATFTLESIGAIAQGFCGIRSGNLYCWGYNHTANPLGQPGGYTGIIGNPIQVTGLPAGAVTHYAGGAVDESYHNCAVANAKVYCWGRNDFGQLGDSTTTDRTLGIPVTPTDWP